MTTKLRFNIIVVGDLGVGKTSIVNRFVSNTFKAPYISTVGMDFFSKKVKLDNEEAKLAIWDTSGREIFRSIRPPYYRNAVGVLLIYDVTRYRSFKNALYWYFDVAEHANAPTVFCFVGNKSDLIMEREVDKKRVEKFAKSCHFIFMETSALLNENIEELFQALSKKIHARNLGVIHSLVNECNSHHQLSTINLKKKRKPIRPMTDCCGYTCFWNWTVYRILRAMRENGGAALRIDLANTSPCTSDGTLVITSAYHFRVFI